MSAKLKKILESNKIQQLKVKTPVCVALGTSIKKTLSAMRAKKRGCAIVIGKKGQMKGIFTERDLLTRVVEPQISLDTPVDRIMTPNPTALTSESFIAEAVILMNKNGYRHIPLLDNHGLVKGLISIRNVLDYLAEHFPCHVYNLPPDPHQISQAPEGA